MYWKVLNTRDYGIPHNRERVYIVGIRGKHKAFEFPKKKKMRKLSSFVDNTNKERQKTSKRIENIIKRVHKDCLFVDLAYSMIKEISKKEYIRCLLKGSNLWNIKYHRYATVKEHLKLQGFRMSFKKGVSDSRLKNQCGNTMSVNVLKTLFKNLL